MTAEDEIKEAMGELASASTGLRLRHAANAGGDAESRLVALELNVQALNRGLLQAARQIQDLRDEISRELDG